MAYNPLVPVEECACAAPGEQSAAPPPSSFDRNASVIQFSAAMYLCTEADGRLQVHVLRLGDSTQRARVYFSTKDASAKAGVKYEARSEMLVFEPGDIKKTVSITLLQDERWDATLEFEMTLSEVQNAALGLYLRTCRAKIIDDDLYPTNQSVDGLSGLGLMREYVKMNLGDPQVFRSTCLHLFFDLIKGLYLFLTFYLSMYLVDVVLSPGEEAARGKEEGEGAERRMLLSAIHGAAKHAARALGEDFGEEEGPGMVAHTLIIPGHRRSTAMVIAALYIVPFGLLHMVDLFRVWLEIPYRIRKTCQASLLSKFLHYRESSRSSLNVGGITMTMMRDTIEVCDLGYMKILRVLGILMKLLFAGIFILAENDKAFIPLVAYPVVLGLFLVARERKTIRVDEDRAHKQNEVVQVVSDMVANYAVDCRLSVAALRRGQLREVCRRPAPEREGRPGRGDQQHVHGALADHVAHRRVDLLRLLPHHDLRGDDLPGRLPRDLQHFQRGGARVAGDLRRVHGDPALFRPPRENLSLHELGDGPLRPHGHCAGPAGSQRGNASPSARVLDQIRFRGQLDFNGVQLE